MLLKIDKELLRKSFQENPLYRFEETELGVCKKNFFIAMPKDLAEFIDINNQKCLNRIMLAITDTYNKDDLMIPGEPVNYNLAQVDLDFDCLTDIANNSASINYIYLGLDEGTYVLHEQDLTDILNTIEKAN